MPTIDQILTAQLSLLASFNITQITVLLEEEPTCREVSKEAKMYTMNYSLYVCIEWNLSIKETLNRGHLSNEDTVCSPNHIELCTNLPLN